MGILSSSGSMSIPMLIVLYAAIFGGAYLLLIRPQRKEKKRMDQMLAEMAVGDTVVTTSGFYGVLIDITDEDCIVEFGNNKNCRIPMKKAAISLVEKADAGYTSADSKSEKSDKADKADKSDK